MAKKNKINQCPWKRFDSHNTHEKMMIDVHGSILFQGF